MRLRPVSARPAVRMDALAGLVLTVAGRAARGAVVRDTGRLSLVTGLRLADRREVVVKCGPVDLQLLDGHTAANDTEPASPRC